MPRDYDFQSTLLRVAAQAGAEQVRLDPRDAPKHAIERSADALTRRGTSTVAALVAGVSGSGGSTTLVSTYPCAARRSAEVRRGEFRHAPHTAAARAARAACACLRCQGGQRAERGAEQQGDKAAPA